MGYEIKKINPTQCTFTYLLGERDCYELRKGICSLYLTEEEAQKISEEEGNQFGEGHVMSCRKLAKSLLDVNYYEDSSFQKQGLSIRMHPRDCGHYVFTDGQHRTCIAKHLNIQSMYVNMENYETDYELNCRACIDKKEEEIENRKIKNRILSILNLKRTKSKKIYGDFIDEDYMKFKTTSPFIKN
ncbi:hypothetical protein [Priestia megaterium]|uniref:hypothetical protein n=1 Tax=Priestia megaterium TaxID=1404 RepID=UPI0018678BB8|nr:hypothetical protein [Priestia megaterium]MBE2977811.1 hypothetical protein [Priestia megaterium]